MREPIARAITWSAVTPAGYTFVDYATQGYLAVVALLILFAHGHAVPHWPWFVAAHVGMFALIHCLVRTHASRRPGRLLDFLRHFYPVLLYAGFYRETAELNQMLISGYADPFFIRLEAAVFGCQPSLALMTAWPFLAVSELLYAAYFSYYVMISGVGLALFLRNRAQFFHYVSVISFVFYVCYLFYIVLPVMGPRILLSGGGDFQIPAELQLREVPDYPAAVQSGPFFLLMAWIYRFFAAPGAAFPSSHVAVAIGTLYFTFRYLRQIRIPHLLAVILLCLATVYCRYHYAVDVIAGILTAGALIPLGDWLYTKFTPIEAARDGAPGLFHEKCLNHRFRR